MTDGDILKRYGNNKVIYWSKVKPEYKEYLENRFKDSSSLHESFYRIKNHIEIRPVCQKCGGYVGFGGNTYGFAKHCCYRCSSTDNNVQNKLKQTCLDKYGETSAMKTEQTKNNLRKSMLNRHGVDNAGKLESTKILSHTKEALEKQYLTKKRNNSFNLSKPELEILNLLKEKFPNIIHQYKSKEYPWNCDFYIPELNLYIEFNGTWLHGGMAFDENNEICINKLNLWKQKSVNSNQYKYAINYWTNLDVRKRETAKKNNLNFMEFYSLAEAKEVLQNL